MHRLLPMISSTDPFLYDGPYSDLGSVVPTQTTLVVVDEEPYFSGLLSPSESLDWDAVHPTYDESFYDSRPELLDDQLTEYSLDSEESIEEILNSISDFAEVSKELRVNPGSLSDFVDQLQKEFPSFVPTADEALIEFPDSPLSMDDSEIPEIQKSLEEHFGLETDGTFVYLASSNEQEQDLDIVMQLEENFLIEEEPKEEIPEVQEVKLSASRSGRVIKRKVYADHDDEDDDYQPPAKKTPAKKAKVEKPPKKQPAKRVRVYDEETKRQNMIAARRYRQKKRIVSDNLDDIYAEEVEKNDKLKKELEQFESEIKIMKELLASVLQPHSILCVQAV